MAVSLEDLNTKLGVMNNKMGELDLAIKEMVIARDADAVMKAEIDPEIKKRIALETPYLEFLKANGSFKSTDAVRLEYKEKTNAQNSIWIDEDDAIAEPDKRNYLKRTAYMKIIHHPIKIGALAQAGGEIDLRSDDLDDGYISMANALDTTLLEGQGTEESKDFRGLFNVTKTNTFDLGGDLLTKDDLNSLFAAINAEKGFPQGLVCTTEVGQQIDDLFYPGSYQERTIEMAGGYTVTAIKAGRGNLIPIIIDDNIDNSNGEKLAVVDCSSVKVKELMAPSVVPFARTDLGIKESIVQFVTSYIDSEFKNGMITGIGVDTDRPVKQRRGDVKFNILGTDGKPVGGAKVSFTNEDGDVFKSKASNNRGLCEIPQLAFGTYNVDFDTVPSGYTKLSYADYEVKVAESEVQLVLTKN